MGGAIFIGSSVSKCQNSSIEWTFPARYLAKLRLVLLGQLGIHEQLKIIDTTGYEMFMISGERVKSDPIIAAFPLDEQLIVKYDDNQVNRSEENGGIILEYSIIPG